MKHVPRKRLLVFNSHEAWVNQLSALDYALDIVVGLSGRYTQDWDTRVHPAPDNARIVDITEAQNSAAP